MRRMQVDEWNPVRARELIKLSGYTRNGIAKEVGISGRTLKNILSGGQTPGYQTVVLLAQVLGCEVSVIANPKERAS